MQKFAFIAAALVAMPAAAQEVPGEVEFNNHCRTCHSLDEGENRLGPSLHGIMGKAAGTTEGYDYSDAFGSADVIWDEDTLDAFIANPDAVVPGNSMKPYSGLTDEAVRESIIAFLSAGDA